MSLRIGMLVFSQMTQLDLTGPFEVLTRIPGAEVQLVGKNLDPVRADSGLRILPTATPGSCGPVDMLFVPGGIGEMAVREDVELMNFVAEQGRRARYVTSVCTGAFVLGEAGLLSGYRATTHWNYLELLAMYGAEPSAERVVVDRNRITAGGVTSGIDFALRVAAETGGEDLARQIQLALEYDPSPPFQSGHPRVAAPELVRQARARTADSYVARVAAAKRWVERTGAPGGEGRGPAHPQG